MDLPANSTTNRPHQKSRPAIAEPEVSVIVPVYGSCHTLPQLYERIANAMHDAEIAYELIFIDDGSPDSSWDVLCELQQTHWEITAIQLMRNFGQHNALMCGFRHARGQILITLDDDLQNPPEEIPKLLSALKNNGSDLVYGVPAQKRHGLGRNLGSRLVNAFFRFVFMTHVTVTSFRAFRRELLTSILNYNLNFTFIDGLFAWNTQRISQTLVSHAPRENGRSGYSLAKLSTLALNLMTNFSLLPLQIASAVGMLASMGGMLIGGYYLFQALLRQITVPGYASIIVAVMILGGIQLMALGVIGEYIGRMHLNVNLKPQYTVRELKKNDQPEPDRNCCSAAMTENESVT